MSREFRMAIVTDAEMASLTVVDGRWGIDEGSVPRLLKSKGLSTSGKVMPILIGTVIKQYNPMLRQTEYTQVLEIDYVD